MARIKPEDFPQIQLENLLAEEDVIGLLSAKNLSLSGVACAIDLRSMPIDPLARIEGAIGRRLIYEMDPEGNPETGIRLGATFGKLYEAHDKKVRSTPRLLIVSIDANSIDTEERSLVNTVTAGYIIPTLFPGKNSATATTVTYGSKLVRPKGSSRPIERLAKLSAKNAGNTVNPYAKPATGNTRVFADHRGSNTLVAKHGGSLGTI